MATGENHAKKISPDMPLASDLDLSASAAGYEHDAAQKRTQKFIDYERKEIPKDECTDICQRTSNCRQSEHPDSRPARPGYNTGPVAD